MRGRREGIESSEKNRVFYRGESFFILSYSTITHPTGGFGNVKPEHFLARSRAISIYLRSEYTN